jgi:hypothetical protein
MKYLADEKKVKEVFGKFISVIFMDAQLEKRNKVL